MFVFKLPSTFAACPSSIIQVLSTFTGDEGQDLGGRQSEFIEIMLPPGSDDDLTWATLDTGEYRRAHGIRDEQLRKTYLFVHNVVRHFFSMALGMDASALTFDRTANGRPFVRELSDQAHFSISYRKGLCAFAVSQIGGGVGVDIELMPSMVDFRTIASRFFTPSECEFVFASKWRTIEQRFFWVWTRKEAFIKFFDLGIDAIENFDVMDIKNNIESTRACTESIQLSSHIGFDYVVSLAHATNLKGVAQSRRRNESKLAKHYVTGEGRANSYLSPQYKI